MPSVIKTEVPLDCDDLAHENLGDSRPVRLPAVSGPQEGVPRRIVEQIVDSAPVVPLLHAPEPQLVDSVVEVRKILDNLLPDVEQVIEVPKIFLHTAPQRSSLLEPQQLVELPVFDYIGFRRYEGADSLGKTLMEISVIDW